MFNKCFACIKQQLFKHSHVLQFFHSHVFGSRCFADASMRNIDAMNVFVPGLSLSIKLLAIGTALGAFGTDGLTHVDEAKR